MYDAQGYSIEGNARRARYKLALCRRLANDAIQEARAIEDNALRNEWLRIAREARRDAKTWLSKARRADVQLCV